MIPNYDYPILQNEHMQRQYNKITSVHMLPIRTGAVGEVSGRKTNRKKNITGLVRCDGSGGRGLQKSLATRSMVEREGSPQSGALTSVCMLLDKCTHTHTHHTRTNTDTHTTVIIKLKREQGIMIHRHVNDVMKPTALYAD